MKHNNLIVLTIVALASIVCLAGPATATSILGTAEDFAVLSGTAITNTGSTTVTGDLGVHPGSSLTGSGSLSLTGTVHLGDAVAGQAQNDLSTAYTALAAYDIATDLTGQDLGGLVLTSGFYQFDSSAQLTGLLTLDAEGNDNAFWVFQIGSTLTTASSSSVEVINFGSNNGADAGLFWVVGSSATLGTSTEFEGNLLAHTSITLNTGANIQNGRALAQDGAVTLDTNTINNFCPPPNNGPGFTGGLMFDESGALVPVGMPVPEPTTVLLLGSGLLGMALRKKRAAVISA